MIFNTMEKNYNGSQQLISDQNINSQVEEILSDEDLGKLVSFFSLLIEIDARNKCRALREKDQHNEAAYRK